MNPTLNHKVGALPELLLPAGSFDAGIAAFEGGADAVYLGFSDFSARKQAKNFSREEYRRFLGLARKLGKKVYVTINTVLLESEIEAASALLSFLGRFPPDAIIIQDWGLATLIKERFPGFTLHASTQTAIRTTAAAKLAARMGVTRVVLPRECSPLELSAFVTTVPELEFEVFVHGALCYSYSGLCLASGMLLGRSGNRGRCAQVCRSYYDAEGPGMNGCGYYFSCKDLSLFDHISDIALAGATSLKVEGRMKSPEYVFALARLYRAGLDRLTGIDVLDSKMLELKNAARTAFSRSPTSAYAAHHSGTDILDPSYPGHRGVLIGRVLSYNAPMALVELSGPLFQRDGLLFIETVLAQESADREKSKNLRLEPKLPEPLACSASLLRDSITGKVIYSAQAGQIIEIQVPSSVRANTLVHRISARAQDRRLPSPEEYAPLVSSINAHITLIQLTADEENSTALSTGFDARIGLELELPRFDGQPGNGESLLIVDCESIYFTAARNPGGFERALSVFKERGNADFEIRLAPPQANISNLFVPPSVLKKTKNNLYALAKAAMETAERQYAAESALTRRRPNSSSPLSIIDPPPRASLVFPYPNLSSGMPFATPRLLREGIGLPEINGRYYLPMAPIVAHDIDYERLVKKYVQKTIEEEKNICVGIDALHHAAFAASLCALDPNGNRLSFFADIHLYIANAFALDAWLQLVPRLAFAYPYIEEADAPDSSTIPMANFFEDFGLFKPPLFISKACLARQYLGKGHCPVACKKSYSFQLSDRERNYTAITEDCITMLFMDS